MTAALSCRGSSRAALAATLAITILGGALHGQSRVGFVSRGATSGQEIGSHIGTIGDLDGDGVGELIIGAHRADVDDNGTIMLEAGRVFIRSGATHALLGTIDGRYIGGWTGVSATGVDDLDGDGVPDLVIGSSAIGATGTTNFGHVSIHSGATFARIYDIDGTIALGSFGLTVCSLGDVDGDAMGDFAVGAPDEGNGVVRVYSGANAQLLWSKSAGSLGSQFGMRLLNVGDVDGNGSDDLAVSDPEESAPSGLLPLTGAVHIFSGADGLLRRHFLGDQASQGYGFSIANAGDFDGDGKNDLLIGSPFTDQPVGLSSDNRGRIDIRSYSTGLVLFSRLGTATQARLGQLLATIGDRDFDGKDEWISGELQGATSTIAFDLQVFSGASGLLQEVIPQQGTRLAALGQLLSGVGDLNGDGRPDFALGNPDFGYVVSTFGFVIDGGLVRVFLSSGPALRRVNSRGVGHRLDLRWLPDQGDPEAIIGSIVADRATPGGLGVIVASLDDTETVLYGYIPLLVNLDPYFVAYAANFGFDATGSFLATGLTRQYPNLAGLHLHLQVFESFPVAAGSNALVIEFSP